MGSEKQNGLLRKAPRNYGIDALRIVSMFMVVILHIQYHGGILDSAMFTNHKIVWFFETACFCAVNCYALISGYVGVFSKYKVSNFLYIWCQVALYSITFTLIFKHLYPDSIEKITLISAFFPVASQTYWYFSAYAVLFLFMPILNIALKNLTKNQIKFFLVCVLVFASAVHSITNHLWGDFFLVNRGYSAWWLIILYLLGGYIRKYGLFNNIKSKRPLIFLLFYCLTVILGFGSKFVLHKYPLVILEKTVVDTTFVHYQSITVVAGAVFLVLAFEKIEFNRFFIKIISFFAPLSFGVFLIHEQAQIRAHSGCFGGCPRHIPYLLGNRLYTP